MAEKLGSPVTTATAYDPFAGPELETTVASTESQRELWTAAQLGPEASLAFNESISLEMRGKPDLEALRASLADLVRRHESLRATFTADGVTFCVLADAAVPFELVDLSGQPNGASDEARRAILAREVESPFDLERGPLARVVALRLAPDLHVVVFTAHHIVVDGWSWSVLVSDWAALYGARLRHARAELPQAGRFSQYAAAQAARRGSPEWQATQAYWVKRFSGEIPVLELPADRPRAPLRTFASRRIDFLVPAPLLASVKRVGAASGASLFATLLAAYKAWLYRLSGQADVVVGVPAAGQAADGFERLVGHCVQTLPLRSRVDPAQPFRELLKAVRTEVLDGFEHQQLTFGELLRELPIRRDPSRPPLVSTFFNLDRPVPEAALAFDGLATTLSSNPRHFESFDLFVNGVETAAGLVLECQYNSGLFDADTIAGYLEAFRVLLAAIAASPESPVGRLELTPPQDMARLAAWNRTEADWPRDRTAHQLIAEQAARSPEAVAVVQGAARLTYAELVAEAGRIAVLLRAAGVARGDLVGLCLERTPTLLPALVAILETGAAYVPLDPSYPRERLAYMVEDSGMKVVVTSSALEARLKLAVAHAVCLDVPEAFAAHSPAGASPARPEDTAYVIYTSGSTGRPKGVRVPHAALVNFLASMAREPGMGPGDRIVAVTTLSFDIAGLELLLPLVTGASVVLADRDVAMDGEALKHLLAASGASVMQATPATWRLLIEAGWRGASGFKALVGGEALPRALARELVERAGSVFNMYGPTETTIWSTCWRVSEPEAGILIGRPIANTQVHVLDAAMQPCPVGVPGELWIGGQGVTLGYLNRPELSAERFVLDPWSDAPGARLYRTGDLARWRASGHLECLGRNDFQVKVRGYRIELGEIEAALASHPAVTQAVVVAREDRPGDVRLCAYVVPRSGTTSDDEALRTHLAGFLPDYMVPQHFVSLESLPLSPAGKIDRQALPAPLLGERDEASYVAPASPTETLLAGLWEQALGLPRVGAHDDFFRLGGHSLLAAQVLSRLNREHGIALAFRTIFEAPTVARLAAVVDGRSREEKHRAAARIPHRDQAQPAAVSLMQERILLLEELDPARRVVHHIPSAFRLEGPLDAAALTGALRDVVGRHEALRTTFRREAGVYRPYIGPPFDLELQLLDLRERSAAERNRALAAFVADEARRPFDLERGPLFRASLLRLQDDEHVLFTLRHNAIWDGWSFDIFRHELAHFYEARIGTRSQGLPALEVAYTDFAAWQREWVEGEEARQQLDFWRRTLAGGPAALELPLDRPRPAERDYVGANEWIEIPRSEADRIAELGRGLRATPFMVLLAAFYALLYRYTGERDLVVACPVRNRPRPELEDLVGLFANTLMLRNRVDPDASFADLVSRVRATTLEGFGHQELPFELLAREAPPVRVVFSLQEGRHRETALGPVRLSLPHLVAPALAVDLNFWLVEMKHGLAGALNYSSQLFDATSVRGFLDQYRELVTDALRHPERPVGRLALVSSAERERLSAGAAPVSDPAHGDDPGLVGWLVAAAACHGALREETSARAGWLHGHGVQAGERVGLAMEQAGPRLVSHLALLWLGAIPVPLDPREPKARLAARLAAAGASWFWGDGVPLDLGPVRVLGAFEAPGTPLARPDAADGVAWLATTAHPDGGFRASAVDGHGLQARLREAVRRLGIRQGSVVATVAGGSPFVDFLALAAGAALAAADEDQSEDSALLGAFLREVDAGALVAPAATWRRLLATGFTPAPGFVVVCPEPLPRDLAERLASGPAAVFTAWGVEEAGGFCCLSSLADAEAGRLLNAPLPGIALRVIEPSLEPAAAGVPGQLQVSHPGAAGWHPGGERARLRSDGRIELLGRLGSRVRVRGRGVELAEVRRVLLGHAAVQDAAIVLHEDAPDEPRLVAYLLPKPGGTSTDTELRHHLRGSLDEAAIPRHFVVVDSLPRRADGALEVQSLPSPFTTKRPAARPPGSPEEELVLGLCRELLGGAADLASNFFDLGGHSLLCLQLVSQLEARTGKRLEPRVFLFGTLEQAAAELARALAPGRS